MKATLLVVATLGLAALALIQPAAGAVKRDVIYLPTDTVKAAFEKGKPLVEVDNYKVHASRREGPGQVEVHTEDTDVIHVLAGTATVVTGGTLIGGTTTAPEEIRGTSIEKGQTRELRPGDVIIIPNGTPHWFKEVPAPMTYFVVKVRAAGAAR